MITLKLLGGLGNQLFIWSMGRALSERTSVQYDLSWFALGIRPYALDKWAIEVPMGQADPHDIHVTDQLMHYRTDLPSDHALLEGYWQCERYFEAVVQKIRWELKLRSYPTQGTPAHDTVIAIGLAPVSCFLHIRRATDPKADTASYHGVLSMSYYREALSHIPQGAQLFVFADDWGWVIGHLMELAELWPVAQQTLVMGNEPHIDLWLMSQCTHGIMANSSFSWWAGWLGPDVKSGIVIAPKQWFAAGSELDRARDICPARWLRV